MMSKKVFAILLSFCLFTGLICLIGMSRELLVYKNADSLYEAMAEEIEAAAEAAVTAGETDADGAIKKEEVKGQTISYENLDFEELRKKYPDIIGWIRSEDGVLNYPVVQRNDNVYYLDHLPDGKENAVGSVFLDCNNKNDFIESVSVVYGHHVKNGMMFGYLDNYRKQEFYEENPYLYLYTEEKNYKIELAAAYLMDGTSGAYPLYFDNEYQMKSYLEKAGENSFFYAQYEVKHDDRLIILSTCAYDFDNARLAVAGLLKEY